MKTTEYTHEVRSSYSGKTRSSHRKLANAIDAKRRANRESDEWYVCPLEMGPDGRREPDADNPIWAEIKREEICG